MLVWIDEQLSPTLVASLESDLGVEAVHVRDLGFASARDRTLFDAARLADAIVLTKDADFPELVRRLGPPPRVVWVTLGNTSTPVLRDALVRSWHRIVEALGRGEPIVELTRVR